MKVIDIINLVAKLIDEIDVKKCVDFCLKNNLTLTQLFNLPTTLQQDEELETLLAPSYLTDNCKNIISTILDALNIATVLVATEYKPLFKIEYITVENNEFLIDNFSQKLFKIKEITLNNVKQKYEIIDDKLCLKSGSYKVKYSYIPLEVSFDDNIHSFNGLSIITMAYLVCSQYCLIKCSFDESSMWQQKFEYALLNNVKPIKNITLKQRRWF